MTLTPYIHLGRFNKPVGIFLLFWPCIWGLGFACFAHKDFQNFFYYCGLFFIGSVVMRAAGCVFNDFLDQDLDKQVERTKSRPLASGAINNVYALAFMGLLLLTGLVVLLQFNLYTQILACCSLILVALYPLMKRIIWWPQAFLGITFNWGVLVGWTSITGSLDWPILTLYAAGVFWTLGYDTIYGFQDIEDDVKVGVKSTSILLRRNAKMWLYLFYLLTSLCWGAVGYLLEVPHGYHMTIGVASFMLFWQVFRVDLNQPHHCLEIFKSNQFVGFLPVIPYLIASIA